MSRFKFVKTLINDVVTAWAAASTPTLDLLLQYRWAGVCLMCRTALALVKRLCSWLGQPCIGRMHADTDVGVPSPVKLTQRPSAFQ